MIFGWFRRQPASPPPTLQDEVRTLFAANRPQPQPNADIDALIAEIIALSTDKETT